MFDWVLNMPQLQSFFSPTYERYWTMKEMQWNVLNNILNNERKPGTKPERKKTTKIAWINHRQNHQRCSIEKGVLKNFAKFTGKHPCQGLFFNQVTVAELRSAKMIIKDHKRWSDIFFIKEYPKHPILYLYLQKFLKLILQIQLL